MRGRQRSTLLLEAGDHLLSAPCTLGAWASHVAVVGAPDGAVLSGGVAVDTFTPLRSGSPILRAPLPPSLSAGELPRQMFVSGGGRSRRPRARHPNLFERDGAMVRDFPYLYWAGELCAMGGIPAQCLKRCAGAGCSATACACLATNRGGFRFNASLDAGVWAQVAAAAAAAGGAGSLPEAVVYHGWTASRHYVDSVDLAGHAVHLRNPADRPIGFWSGRGSEGGQRYYVENAEALLDAPGEWFIRPGSPPELLYWPLDGEEPGSFVATLPRTDTLLRLEAVSGLSFDSVGLSYADWACGGPNKTEPCDQQSAQFQDRAAVELSHTRGVRFANVTITSVGSQALWAVKNNSGTLVSRSRMHDLGTGAVRVGQLVQSPNATPKPGMPPNLNITVEDSVLADGGWVFPSGTAVLVQSDAEAVTVAHNEIKEFSYTAVSLGWSWSYLPQVSASNHTVAYNRIHHLGFPRRETGDAMACVYTLGQLNGTVVENNVCHDVRAYMSGGYCLSQDQGSSNLLFRSNVCLRTTGSPHNTHYGEDVVYENNVFYSGYHDAWTDPSLAPAGGLRTSPNLRPGTNCNARDFASACPDRLAFKGNLIGHDRNTSSLLFEGNWNESAAREPGALRFDFERNLYWTEAPGADLASDAVFGGQSRRMNRGQGSNQLTWPEWTALHEGRQDRGSVLAKRHPFTTDAWADTLDVTVRDDVAARIGWQQIDSSKAGPRPE